MSELDICTLGAASLNSETNVATCDVSRQFGPGGEEEEPLGTAAIIQCLGVTSLPLGPSDSGHADGIVMTPCGSYSSGVIGATDTRCADVYGMLEPGETCIHDVGEDPDKRARTFYKQNCAATIVGNDVAWILDKDTEKVTLAAFGHVLEVSASQGMVLCPKGGKCGIRLAEDGSVTIWGASVSLGGLTTPGTPATAVLMGPAGIAGVPAPNVFITL